MKCHKDPDCQFWTWGIDKSSRFRNTCFFSLNADAYKWSAGDIAGKEDCYTECWTPIQDDGYRTMRRLDTDHNFSLIYRSFNTKFIIGIKCHY